MKKKETNTLLLKLKVVEQFFKLKMKKIKFSFGITTVVFFKNAQIFAQFTKKNVFFVQSHQPLQTYSREINSLTQNMFQLL